MTNLPAPSMMIGMLDQQHVAAFAVAESIAVELTYEDPVPRFELDVCVARSRELLARAYAETRSFLAIDARRRE
ncbi:MAG TPA: hypothetical protein VFU37_23595, partial [Pyrinomonadaceae bacterium]|nr:hypothetical protein [Pyrinomonadaceae bacterium]